MSANEKHSREIWKTEDKEKWNRGEIDLGFIHLGTQQIFIKILHVAGIVVLSGAIAPVLLVYIL